MHDLKSEELLIFRGREMSEKNSENEEFAIKRITTPHGDVPTLDSMVEAFNLLMNRINSLSKNFTEKMKYSGASLEASEFIERHLLETNSRMNDLKKKLFDNSEEIEGINNHVMKLEKTISNLENLAKSLLNGDTSAPSKSYDDIIEIKELTKYLKESIIQLQRSLGEGPTDIEELYWEYKSHNIRENLADVGAYEAEKNRILAFLKILSLPKPVLDIESRVLLIGARGNGKTTLIRALAKDQEITLIELNLPFLISLKPPKQVESLHQLFHFLKSSAEIKPFIFLLDNLEMLQEIQGNPQYLPLLQTLLLEIGKISLIKDRILVIGIVNGTGFLNEEIIEQFNEKIEMPLPNQISRALILRKLLNKTNLEMQLDLDDISSKFAESTYTDQFSGKDLNEVLNIAKFQAFSEGRTMLAEKDIDLAIQVLKEKKKQSRHFVSHKSGEEDSVSKGKINDLQEELRNIKMLLMNSTRMVKHALRLALTDNYNFITRLFNHYESTKKALTIKEIEQISGLKEENVLKLLKKMPYRMLFPKVGEEYYVVFDKVTLEEILADLALSL